MLTLTMLVWLMYFLKLAPVKVPSNMVSTANKYSSAIHHEQKNKKKTPVNLKTSLTTFSM